MDQAISCLKKKKTNLTWFWESKCCIIFKSRALGSVKTSDEYREGCEGEHSLHLWICVCVCVHTQVVWIVPPRCCLRFWLKDLFKCALWLGRHRLGGRLLPLIPNFTSCKVMNMKQGERAASLGFFFFFCWTQRNCFIHDGYYWILISLIKWEIKFRRLWAESGFLFLYILRKAESLVSIHHQAAFWFMLRDNRSRISQKYSYTAKVYSDHHWIIDATYDYK